MNQLQLLISKIKISLLEILPYLSMFLFLFFLFVFQACDRMYPLTTDTPVLLANSGIFMFPDSLSDTSGSYVGLVLSSELPAADCEMFQDLLLQLTDFRVQVRFS